MTLADSFVSKHFTVEPLGPGVYACLDRAGGAAFSNSGIIDLGGRTLVVDALDAVSAGRDLRRMAESLCNRSVDSIVFTHMHADHWVGASAFDDGAVLWASEVTAQAWHERAEAMLEELADRDGWEAYRQELEDQLQSETDERTRAGLVRTATRVDYALAEMGEWTPRFASQTFREPVSFEGDQRVAELRSLGAGHSGDDAVLLLPEDGVAFIGDIGFFHSQPYMGACDLDLYREQVRYLQASGYRVLAPGHGPVGGQAELALQMQYFDVLEDLVGDVVQRGGSLEEALQVTLPAPFDAWLMGGMARFELNVRYMYGHLGGALPE